MSPGNRRLLGMGVNDYPFVIGVPDSLCHGLIASLIEAMLIWYLKWGSHCCREMFFE